LLIGVAPTPEWVIAARALQGIGAAVVAPSSLALLTARFPEGQGRPKAVALYGATAGIGASLGPVAGGAVASWVLLVLAPAPHDHPSRQPHGRPRQPSVTPHGEGGVEGPSRGVEAGTALPGTGRVCFSGRASPSVPRVVVDVDGRTEVRDFFAFRVRGGQPRAEPSLTVHPADRREAQGVMAVLLSRGCAWEPSGQIQWGEHPQAPSKESRS
jgi:hypothetical protein